VLNVHHTSCVSPNIPPYSANCEAALTVRGGEYVAFIGDDDAGNPELREK
jgi:hypothetical protein